MTVFWLVAAMFVLGALLFLLPPLWTQASAAQAAAATEAPAPSARGGRHLALALALLLPLASVLTYLQLGRPDAVAPQLVAAPAQATPPSPGASGDTRHAVTPGQLQQRAMALAERLQAEPGDAQGWVMLGRTHVMLARYADGAAALRRAAALMPRDASLLADLADVTGMAQGKRLAGEPARLVQQALDLDPRHGKALALAGSAAFETRDYPAARHYWQRLLELLPPGSDMARAMQGSIAQATQLESGLQTVSGGPGGPGNAGTAVAAATTPPPAGAVPLTGTVQISAALRSRLAPGDTLFVFARAAQGPRMPLAIVRRPADGQAYEFRLDDSMAMQPAMRLSAFAQVVVGARISRSGNATPQAGDLFGQSAVVAPTAQGVQVLIDSVQP
jgi:cytochrome c-type biogenesis protein CcmH